MNLNRKETGNRRGAPVPSAEATSEEWLEDSIGQVGQAKDAKVIFF